MDESKQEFIAEGEEILQRLAEQLRYVEEGKSQDGYMDAIYRDIHTLKGSSYLFGYKELGSFTHVIETCLDPIRQGHMEFSPQFVDVMLSCLDLIEELIFAIRDDKKLSDYEGAVSRYIGRVVDVACSSVATQGISRDDPVFTEQIQQIRKEKVESEKPMVTQVKLAVKEKAASPSIDPVPKTEKKMAPKQSKKMAVDDVPVERQEAKPAAVVADASIRVQVGLLDNIMNLVGELVLVRNQVKQFCSEMDHPELQNLGQRLDLVTADLQGDVMKTRMQPIGNVISKFHRTVRDISHDMGKKIQVELEGMQTELDKTLLEAIKDPLTHIIRNACDHGLETPAERKISGKAESGKLWIKAYHEGGHVIIDIADDGRGIDKEKILSKAIEKKLVAENDTDSLTERDILHLIFSPGFSTAEKVSAVSGRGVGMDVVRTNIEQIGGSVEVKSELGDGTHIQLRIPLTLAIVAAMVVQSGDYQYAIPQGKVAELVRVDLGERETDLRVEYVQDKPVLRLRGKLLPLIFLNDVFAKEPCAREESELNVVVLKSDHFNFGLVVDEIFNTADIVVKPLDQFLKSLEIFSGATIMGDGSVSLILDVSGIGVKSQLRTDADIQSIRPDSAAEVVSSEAQDFLVFRLDNDVRFAMPLCLVNRLEEFSCDLIEFSGEQPVVRYRNSILPLLNVQDFLNLPSESIDRETHSIIVIEKGNRKFGLQVKSIEDVISINETIDDSIRDRVGILGNLVTGDQMTVVLDVYALIEGYLKKSNFSASTSTNSGQAREIPVEESQPRAEVRILLAEDTAFFRRHVAKLLRESGFVVETAEDGKIALEILQEGGSGRFQAIVTDIEMPNMNGLVLTENIRLTEEYKDIPVIALTTKFRERDIEAGRRAGVTDYLEKLNGDELLNCLDKLVG